MILLVFIPLMVHCQDDKKIYKYTDENGVTHYSDKKLDDTYQEADQLPELTVVPPIEKNAYKSKRVDRATQKAMDAEKKAGDYSGFAIASPKNEENLWGTGGKLSAAVNFNGELLPTHRIQFIIDGKKQPPKEDTSQVFDGMIRGEHKLKAAIVVASTGEAIRQTESITFFIHQNSKK